MYINQTVVVVVVVVVVYPPPPVAWWWSDCPVVCSAAMLSLHFASSSVTATGFVHKSQGVNQTVHLQRLVFLSITYR